MYRNIKEHFLKDDVFSTRKEDKYYRGYTHFQLFVTDKGYINVDPMKSKEEVKKAIDKLTKELSNACNSLTLEEGDMSNTCQYKCYE